MVKWLAALFVVGLACVVPGRARASDNASYDAAMQKCAAYIANPGSMGDPGWYYSWGHYGFFTNPHCVAVVKTVSYVEVQATDTRDGSTFHTGEWDFTGAVPPPPNPCLTKPDIHAQVAVDGLGVVNACDGQCAFTLVDGEQTSNGFGKSLMVGTWHATGQACSAPPPPGWGGDGSSSPPPPQLCGGGSCYDSGSGNYCMVDAGGKQVCTPGPKPGTGGSCASSDKGTICTGSPPPLPSKPPASPISDPPTEITSSDNFTHSQTTPPPAGSPAGTPPTVTNTTVTTNTYGTGGQSQSPTTSGQKTGDSGPAPASSTGGTDKGTASGGGDCNTPPICSGDAPTCMVVSQTWMGRCKKDNYDLDGDGVPDWVGKGSDLFKPDQPGDVAVGAVVSTETVKLDGIDSSSWAGNTCPQLPNLTLFDREITYGDQALFCDWLSKLRPIFLLVCGFISMRILASGGKS